MALFTSYYVASFIVVILCAVSLVLSFFIHYRDFDDD